MNRRRLSDLIGQYQEKNRPRPLSNRDLAKKLGTSYSTISAWKNCENVPSTESLEQLAELFGMLPEDLIAELNGRSTNNANLVTQVIAIASEEQCVRWLFAIASRLNLLQAGGKPIDMNECQENDAESAQKPE